MGTRPPPSRRRSDVPPRALSFDRAGRTLVVGWADGRIDLLDAATGATRSTRRTTAKLRGIDRPVAEAPDVDLLLFVPCGPISPDGHWLPEWSPIASGINQGLRITGLTGKESSSLVNVNFNLHAAACFHPDDAILATGDQEQVTLWDVRTGKQAAVLRHPDGNFEWPADVAFSPLGNVLAEVGNRGMLRFWDPGAEKSLIRVRTGLAELQSLAWSRDGLHLAVGGPEAVVLYQLTGRGARRFLAQENRRVPRTLAPHPSQALVASGNDRGEIELLDARSERVINHWLAYPSSKHQVYANFIAFDPSGSLLATGPGMDFDPNSMYLDVNRPAPDALAQDLFITIWDGRTGKPRCGLPSHQGLVASLDWDPSGRRIASTTASGGVFVNDVATGTTLQTWQRGQDFHLLGPFAAFLEGGGELVVGEANGLLEILDATTGRVIRRTIVECGIFTMVVSADRRRLVATHYDGRFSVLSLPDLTRIAAPERVHENIPRSGGL